MPEYKHRLQVWKPYARTVAATAGAKYGFDPVTIAGLATAIAQLVNLFISCGKRNVDPNPETFQATVRERCSTAAGRRNLRNKLARRFAEHQSAVKGDREMYRGIADTMINQMLEEPPALVAACVAACGDDE